MARILIVDDEQSMLEVLSIMLKREGYDVAATSNGNEAMEFIQSGAKICPQCHSYQSPQRWKILGMFLKWIAGLTAIITLILGAKQPNDIIQTN